MSARRPAAPRTRAPGDGGSSGSATRTNSPRTSPPRAASGRAGSRAGAPARSPSTRAPAHPRGKSSPTPPRTRRGGRSRQGGAAAEEQREPRQITVRGLVLFVVVLMAFIVLAPTLRAYVSMQEQNRDLGAQIAATEERNAELQAQIDQWNDPVYIQSQARDRLGFVMPGETPYRVVDPETVTGEEPASAEDDQGPVSVPPTGPWYLTVWDSVQVAGEVED
ncbi:septum formation initiator family protein [Ruania suaedae]|uniref:FtsB family cell division protein n=1 Tax=Ruania suaedae TaxID=2897774 RepID=UPI001E37CEC7|nr:septum formation initiator family protein [Ruania suaedae]UFU03826.1 septum formation initiator family protein [Ruania suaedae]